MQQFWRIRIDSSPRRCGWPTWGICYLLGNFAKYSLSGSQKLNIRCRRGIGLFTHVRLLSDAICRIARIGKLRGE